MLFRSTTEGLNAAKITGFTATPTGPLGVNVTNAASTSFPNYAQVPAATAAPSPSTFSEFAKDPAKYFEANKWKQFYLPGAAGFLGGGAGGPNVPGESEEDKRWKKMYSFPGPGGFQRGWAQGGIASLTVGGPSTGITTSLASGGISDLGGYSDGGRMLRGPGDGMSDSIPASIADKRPARLADNEFVVPADVVSHLGNGSSDAGARQLYAMMDRVRKARTGTKKQGREIKPGKFMPA